jgi:hypothetical protein
MHTLSCPLCPWTSTTEELNAETEATVKAHFQTHPVEDWAQCVMVLSNTLNMLEAQLNEARGVKD